MGRGKSQIVQDQQIKIARRFSGGGAVYHDPGNLNLTFIETGQIMQTDKYTIQIMNFLKTLGVHVEVDERKGLTIGGFKISGSDRVSIRIGICTMLPYCFPPIWIGSSPP